MLKIGVLQQPPLLISQPQTGAVLAGCPHLGENCCECWITLKAHSRSEFAYIVLVFEHGLRDSVLLRLAIWFGEKRARGRDRRELQGIA